MASLRWDSNPDSGDRQLAVSGNALDHTAIKAGPLVLWNIPYIYCGRIEPINIRSSLSNKAFLDLQNLNINYLQEKWGLVKFLKL